MPSRSYEILLDHSLEHGVGDNIGAGKTAHLSKYQVHRNNMEDDENVGCFGLIFDLWHFVEHSAQFLGSDAVGHVIVVVLGTRHRTWMLIAPPNELECQRTETGMTIDQTIHRVVDCWCLVQSAAIRVTQ